MPSGKRRRAALKKKEKETQNVRSSSNDNPQGNNDGNSQDERGNDGGDVGSTASQEHDNPQDQFKERNEELGDRDLPSTRQDVSEETSAKGVLTDGEDVQTVGLKDDDGVRIERELKEDSASENVAVGHADSAKRSYNGDNRSSSSSSSDEESQVVERRLKEDAYASVSEEKSHKDLIISVNSLAPEVIQTTEDAPAGKTTSSVAEAAAFSDSVQHEVSVNVTTDSTVVESLATSNDAVKRGFENGAQKVLPTEAPSTLLNPVPKKLEDRASPLLKETAQVSVAESVPKENESQVLLSSSILDQVSNNADSIKEPEIPEYSEKLPLLPPPPPVTQKTSWFGCCGILDVFTGSGR